MKRKLLGLVMSVCLGFLLVACGNEVGSDSVIKLGINGEVNSIWKSVQSRLAEEGIILEFVTFSDYNLPNTALADGEIDANAFQTIAFFEEFKSNHNLDLTSIGYTVLAPMGIYSSQLTDVAQLQEGDRVSIPNDASNGGRALLLLQDAGLITLKEGVGITPTVKDIIANPKKLEIVELVAQQLPRSFEDVAVAVINNGVAVQAGLSPLDDSIYVENTESETVVNYYNLIAVRTEDQDKEALKRLVEVYQTEETKKAIEEEYKGASIPAF
ncbi:MetQ/NlpA family ABC transporter substrate-binding protein [Turicibacter sanguinis]|uniref:MetQ/NlpA family ABC transporter substrate-binding protein n=1 Tax=Turicibacter sanguinis TaxID=154288 RepID=UPI00399B454C